MANGNPHKMHSGYRRSQQKVPTSMLILHAHQEEATRRHEECLDEMESDEMDCCFDSYDYNDYDEGETGLELYDFGYDAFDLESIDSLEESLFAPRPENEWRADDYINPNDEGIGKFRYYMESIRPDEIPQMNALWIVSKYTIITAMILSGSFSAEFLSEPSALIGRYGIALEKKLKELGIEFIPFEGITEAGWATYNELYKKTTAASIGHC